MGLLIEQQQDEVERNDGCWYVKDQVWRTAFEKEGHQRSEEGTDVDHHVEESEPDGGIAVIRCLGDRSRDDRFEEGSTQCQVDI